MLNSEICYKAKYNETENIRSEKNLGFWTQPDYRFSELLGLTIYLILLCSRL